MDEKQICEAVFHELETHFSTGTINMLAIVFTTALLTFNTWLTRRAERKTEKLQAEIQNGHSPPWE